MPERLPAPELPDWLSEQVPFDRYMVEAGDGLRMHVMEKGEGQPVLLFHGNPTWGYLYRRVVAELMGEPLRLIMPDLIGLGFSDKPGSVAEHTLDNHSRWMSAALGQLEVEDAVVVVQDWGGPIGLHSVMQHDGLMGGLVVLNTSIDAPKPGFKGTTFHRLMGGPLGGLLAGLGVPHRYLRMAQGDKGSIKGIVQKSYSYPLQGGRAEAARALVLMVPDSMRHPSVEPLRELGDFVRAFDGPAAIVWGDRDPVLGRLRNRISRQIPQASVTSTDAGHFIQEEKPAEIAAAIREVARL